MGVKKTLNNKLPIVKDFYSKVNFSDSSWSDGGNSWDAPTLYAFAEERSYRVFELPLAGIDLSVKPFNLDNLDYFIYQLIRVQNTDLEKPILLDQYGRICDGYHRVCKAILNGDRYIKAIRLEEMPDASGTYTVKE